MSPCQGSCVERRSSGVVRPGHATQLRRQARASAWSGEAAMLAGRPILKSRHNLTIISPILEDGARSSPTTRSSIDEDPSPLSPTLGLPQSEKGRITFNFTLQYLEST